jgi:eukaryotic-like serine/threonine-protein kinase
MSHDLKLLSDLLDEALDLDEAACEAFLKKIQQTQPTLVLKLREMLQLRATLETDELLTLNGRRFNAGSPLAAIQGRADEEHVSLQRAFSSALTPGTMIGPYRLTRCLGEGGMASVWLAERNDETLKRTVALKLLHAWRHTQEVVERFARERDILAQLTHPNIARLYDAGVTESGLPWIALEHVDGTHITAYADERRLTIRERVSLMLQVMEAVQYAHQNFVVHRDIKPGNILIDAEGHAHLLDFGIAKLVRAQGEGIASAMETALTEASGRTLTLRYAAPEQIEGNPITAATDVYALGLVMAELFTGANPRVVASHKILQLAVLEAEITRPSRGAISHAAAEERGKKSVAQLQSELQGDLDTIILKSLARDSSRRYATVSAFSDDLKAWLERRPIRARTPSLAYRGQLLLLRNRWPVALAVTIAVVVSVASFQSWKSNRALNEQRAHTERLQHFMAGVLTDMEPPSEGGNEVLTAKLLLDRGRDRANQEYANQPAFRGEILGELARVYLHSGETAVGMETLNEAISLLEKHAATSDSALNKARAQLGGMLIFGTERERGIALLESVLRDCRREGAGCDEAKADAHLLLADGTSTDLSKAAEHGVQAATLYRAVRGANSIEVLQALIHTAYLERLRGNLAGAKRWLAEAEAIAERTPLKRKEYVRLHNTRAAIALDDGNYLLAAQTLDALIAGRMTNDLTGLSGSIFAFRGWIALLQGQTTEALKNTAKARQNIDRQQVVVLFAKVELYEARAYSIDAQHELAAKRILDAHATMKLAGVTEGSEMWHIAKQIEAETYARLGDTSTARKLATDSLALQRASPLLNFRYLVHALDLLGAVSTAAGDASEAIKLHSEELDILDRSVDKKHPLRMRAALQLALAKRAATQAGSNDIKELAQQLVQTLPADSKYLEVLLPITAGTFKHTKAFLLF